MKQIFIVSRRGVNQTLMPILNALIRQMSLTVSAQDGKSYLPTMMRNRTPSRKLMKHLAQGNGTRHSNLRRMNPNLMIQILGVPRQGVIRWVMAIQVV